jgi:hypothetical protein
MRIGFLVIVSLVLAFVPSARASATNNGIIFQIVAEKCELRTDDNEVEISFVLRNRSRSAVKVSLAGLGSQILFSKIPSSLSEDPVTETAILDPGTGQTFANLLTIRPGETVWREARIRLPQSMRKPGYFVFSAVFSGSVGASNLQGVFAKDLKSNELLFRVLDPIELQ